MFKRSLSYWHLVLILSAVLVCIPGPYRSIDGRRVSVAYHTAYHAEEMAADVHLWVRTVEGWANESLLPMTASMGSALARTVSDLVDSASITFAPVWAAGQH